jgi:N-acetyl-anhydromuramoyl-L-alanine amidase
MTTLNNAQPDLSGTWGPYSPGGIETGWLQSAIRLASPHFGPRPAPNIEPLNIDLLIIHSISLPPGEFGTGAVQQLFTGRLNWSAHPYYQSIQGLKVSAHFFIDRLGVVWQFVDCDLRAWHAGVSHYRGRGQCNDDSIGIELEGLEGGTFEPAQYQSLVTVCQQLVQRYPITHIAGHEHVAPGRKYDPGSGFDWESFKKELRQPEISFPN